MESHLHPSQNNSENLKGKVTYCVMINGKYLTNYRIAMLCASNRLTQSTVPTGNLATGIRKSGGSKLSSVRVMDQGKPSSRPEIANANRLKIVGGTAKGRKIDSPDVYLRPMMAKVCNFNILYHM